MAPTRPVLNGFQEISPDQVRNLNGYRGLLPAYLPAGYKLARISYSNNAVQQILTLLSEFSDGQGRSFSISAQVVPATPTPTITITPNLAATLTIIATSGVTIQIPSITPTLLPTQTLRPTALSATFQQENILIRGQLGLFSEGNGLASLSWLEGRVSYFINGTLSRDEILKVAASLQ